MFFPKRIPEPKAMGDTEMKVFEELSLQNYQRWIIPFVDEALGTSKLKTGTILDVGCGPGFVVKELASRSKNFLVFGVDISPQAVKLAKKNCKGLTNVMFYVANILHLPFDNNTFNLVVCKDSLHHFPNIRKALRETIRVLKDNGTLYMQDMRRDLPIYLLRRSMPFDTTLKKLQFYSTRAAYTKQEMRNIFRELQVPHFWIKTRKLTDTLRNKYKKQGIDIKQLKEGFQARYILMAKQSK